MPEPSLTNSPQLSSQQQAQLQALGINLYEAVKQIDLAEQSWLNDLCNLLKITTDACVFDESVPRFDDKNRILHLPSTSYASEAALKKLIWQNIRPFVS